MCLLPPLSYFTLIHRERAQTKFGFNPLFFTTVLRKIDWLWSGLSIGGLKHTLIRIERMKQILDAIKRCDSEEFQLLFLTYRFVSLFVLSFWVTDLTRTHAGF